MLLPMLLWAGRGMLKESEKKGNRRKYWGKAWVFMTFSLPALPTEEKAAKAINEMPSRRRYFEAQVHFNSTPAELVLFTSVRRIKAVSHCQIHATRWK